MAVLLAEVMNRDVLSFERGAPARTALELMLATGVTSAPVLDGRGHPVGVVSMRELVRAPHGTLIDNVISGPAIVARAESSLLDAARLLDEAGLHHLVVVDPDGQMVGFTSTLDILRGIIGAPVRHPDTFVHWEAEVGMAFSNDRALDAEHVGVAPHAPGLIVLLRGGAGRPERVVWAETTPDLKRWLFDFLSAPELKAERERLQAQAALRYRYAEIADPATREEIAYRVRAQAQLRMDRDAAVRTTRHGG